MGATTIVQLGAPIRAQIAITNRHGTRIETDWHDRTARPPRFRAGGNRGTRRKIQSYPGKIQAGTRGILRDHAEKNARNGSDSGTHSSSSEFQGALTMTESRLRLAAFSLRQEKPGGVLRAFMTHQP